MPRSTYIYLVGPPEGLVIYATFTVKREAHEWAFDSVHSMQDLELSRMKDYPRGTKICGERDIIEWDQKTLDNLLAS